jgi:hypothetical protein
MASPDSGGSLYDNSNDDRRDASSEDTHTISDRSDRTTESVEGQGRTERHHHQECSRHLDCPTHTIERGQSSRTEGEPSGVSRTEGDSYNPGPSTRSSQDSSRTAALGDSRAQPSVSTPELLRHHTSESWDSLRGTVRRSSSGRQRGSWRMDHPDEDIQPVWPYETSRSTAEEAVRAMDNLAYVVGRAPAPAFHQQLPPRSTSNDLFMSAGEVPGYHGHALPPAPRQRTHNGSRRPSDAGPPRWVPDAEVTYCPICQTQFSFFVRKHHCR